LDSESIVIYLKINQKRDPMCEIPELSRNPVLLAMKLPTSSFPVDDTELLVWGTIYPEMDSKFRHEHSPEEKIPLISRDRDGRLRWHFDPEKVCEGILLETYYDGLQPTLELRLPFNYSLIPSWIKGIARTFRMRGIKAKLAIPFPGLDTPFALDWLHELCLLRWGKRVTRYPNRAFNWPEQARAAVVVTHDVDNNWIFENPKWLERFLDIEEENGFQGAWYVVPRNSQSRAANRGIDMLRSRSCEIGCHGYNHDGKWPLLPEKQSKRRMDEVLRFRDQWGIRGFRSEWLWRTPAFLEMLSKYFQYDTSVPTISGLFTSISLNGCGSFFPFRTHGGLMELPLTLPMDEVRHQMGLSPDVFWREQKILADSIIDRGGLVMISLHPQPHQAANDATLGPFREFLQEINRYSNLWKTLPWKVAERTAGQLPDYSGQGS
jgi:hypothetical protein